MSTVIDDLKVLNRKIEQLQLEQARQEGIKEQLLIDLKETFEVENVETAEKLLKEFELALDKDLVELGELKNKLQDIVDKHE